MRLPRHLEGLPSAGYGVVGLSPDEPAKLARFRAAEGLTFPLLSDSSREVLTAYGAYGEKSLYGKIVVGSADGFSVQGDARSGERATTLSRHASSQ